MTGNEVSLTPVDKIILQSYKTLVDGLADYMGSGCEIVLHSLADLECSVIKIVNGEHTGRRAGAPITDLALNMLGRITQQENSGSISYNTTNRRGDPMKSCTISIPGENGRIIGLLCINYYLNTPLSTIMRSLCTESSALPVRETFADNTEQLVQQAVESATATVDARQNLLPSMRNREIVSVLLQQGIFKMKDSVVLVANAMQISKNTVYLHLRHLQGKN